MLNYHSHIKLPYAGKPEAVDGPYYIDSTEDYVKYLVNESE